MILGMDRFTLTHVPISLIGIGTGLVLLLALMGGRNPGNWAALFLLFTVLTSVTGFFFHNDHITPAQIVGRHFPDRAGAGALRASMAAAWPASGGGPMWSTRHARPLPECLCPGDPVLRENPAAACHRPRQSARRSGVHGDPGRGPGGIRGGRLDSLAAVQAIEILIFYYTYLL